MTGFYNDLAQDALDLIEEFGRQVELASDGSVPTISGQAWRGVQPTDPVTITAVILDPTEADRNNFPTVQFSRTALVAAQGLSVTPRVEDRIIDGGQEFRIVRVVETKPGPASLLFTLLLAG